MRIDAYTHFFPKKFFDKLNEVAGDYKDMGKRMRSLPALYDLDVRKKIVDGHKDYQQILSYPQPPIERFCQDARQDIDEFCSIINDGFAELCAKEKDHFPGWVAQVSLDARDAGVAEAERAIKNGALGVQIYTNVAGKPLDRPQYLPFWKKMNELGKPIWLHPARGAEMPDYPRREEIAVRDLVDARLVVRDRLRDDAAGLFQDHGQQPEPQDHHAPLRRHRADARRPARPGQRRDGLSAPPTRTTSRCARA